MNYRHHYHAGNYADVFKHALLLLLIRAMQRKEKGFLYLDTHAGRGGYDLSMPSVLPDGRSREDAYAPLRGGTHGGRLMLELMQESTGEHIARAQAEAAPQQALGQRARRALALAAGDVQDGRQAPRVVTASPLFSPSG